MAVFGESGYGTHRLLQYLAAQCSLQGNGVLFVTQGQQIRENSLDYGNQIAVALKQGEYSLIPLDVLSSRPDACCSPADPLLDALLAAFSERIRGPAEACTQTLVILDRILSEKDLPEVQLLLERSRSLNINLVICLSEMRSLLGQAVLDNSPTVVAFRHTAPEENLAWKDLLGESSTVPFRWPWQSDINQQGRSELRAGEAFLLERAKPFLNHPTAKAGGFRC